MANTALTPMCVACCLMCAVTTQAQLGKLGSKILREGNLEAAEGVIRAVTLTDKQMQRLAQQTIQHSDASNPVAPDGDPYAERLKRLVANHKSEDGLDLNFRVYKVADVNAFAAPDGSVRVMAGLMDLMTDDELRSIIGHEIGHVKLKHSKKQFQKEYTVAAGRNAATANTGVVSFVSEGAFGDFVEGALNAKFSRKDEAESDAYGFGFMVKHGYDYHAMETAFAKLKVVAGEPRGHTLYASHPDPGNRAALAKQRAKAEDAKRQAASSSPSTSTETAGEEVDAKSSTETGPTAATN